MIRRWSLFKRIFEGFTVVLYDSEQNQKNYLNVDDFVFNMQYFHIGCDEVELLSVECDRMEVTIVL